MTARPSLQGDSAVQSGGGPAQTRSVDVQFHITGLINGGRVVVLAERVPVSCDGIQSGVDRGHAEMTRKLSDLCQVFEGIDTTRWELMG